MSVAPCDSLSSPSNQQLVVVSAIVHTNHVALKRVRIPPGVALFQEHDMQTDGVPHVTTNPRFGRYLGVSIDDFTAEYAHGDANNHIAMAIAGLASFAVPQEYIKRTVFRDPVGNAGKLMRYEGIEMNAPGIPVSSPSYGQFVSRFGYAEDGVQMLIHSCKGTGSASGGVPAGRSGPPAPAPTPGGRSGPSAPVRPTPGGRSGPSAPVRPTPGGRSGPSAPVRPTPGGRSGPPGYSRSTISNRVKAALTLLEKAFASASEEDKNRKMKRISESMLAQVEDKSLNSELTEDTLKELKEFIDGLRSNVIEFMIILELLGIVFENYSYEETFIDIITFEVAADTAGKGDVKFNTRSNLESVYSDGEGDSDDGIQEKKKRQRPPSVKGSKASRPSKKR